MQFSLIVAKEGGKRMGQRVRKAVIPVAGKGTRLLPFTRIIPKELYPIIDRPAIQYVIEELMDAGIEQVILVTGRGKHLIEDYFDYTPEMDLHLEMHGKRDLLEESRKIAEMVEIISVRQKIPLGLGHAVLQVKNIIGDEPFVIALPDEIFADVNPTRDVLEVWDQYNIPVILSMKVSEEDVSRYGIFEIGKWLDERVFEVKGMVEKPSPSEAPSREAIIGRYVMVPEIFHFLEKTPRGKGNEIQLTDAMEMLRREREFLGVEYRDGKRFDVGNKVGVVEAITYFALNRPDLSPQIRQVLSQWLK